jgi:putative transposase
MEDRIMKKKRYNEEQIIGILREVESGAAIAEVCRRYEVSEATVYRWREKYRGLDREQLHRLKELEAENVRLRKVIAQQAMDNATLKDLLGKKW